VVASRWSKEHADNDNITAEAVAMAMDDAALPLPAAALPHSDSDHPEQQSGHIIEVINQFINQTYQLLRS